MAATVAEPPPEIPLWLKTLPLAPEYHPSLAEFEDPISYILKVEKEASNYGICKIIPPVPPPPKKTVISNLNCSLAARNSSQNLKSPPTFATRHQQIGFCPRKPRPVQKPVWQSGENYTLQQFEAKAKHFEKTLLKRSGKKGLSALEIETLFWKASVDKPFTVEYANDVPGSAFVPIDGKKWREAGEMANVGETAWNMRGVSRAKGSLLRFMKEEIPGVTSPMVYVAMLFSWFAWHVEDHDLHSLNYMHMGAGKTWYGVPRDARVAFEEVIRVNGYGGEVNPLVTFATLGEKTTVMSPEVLIGAGIPCCRLVQNVGEFVVTFPGAYHSGFSHGFNCGEAANIATPGWLRVAKEAAIRRASINYPPMVSHFQLLYELALTLCSRIPTSISTGPRSSRLKDKKRGEGETMVKELFVQNVIQNNDLLHVLLEQGSSCVLLPQNSSGIFECSNSRVGSQIKVKPRLSLGLCSNKEEAEALRILPSDDIMLNRNLQLRHLSGFHSVKGKSSSKFEEGGLAYLSGKYDQSGNDDVPDTDTERGSTSQGAGLLDQGLFSCVMCGILSFACAAVIQPREAAARYFASADCSFFNDWDGSGVPNDRCTIASRNENTSELNYNPARMKESYQDGLFDVPVQSGDYQVRVVDQRVEVVSDSDTVAQKGISSLDLLAFAYGNTSDSEEEQIEKMHPSDENDVGDCSPLSDKKLFESAHIFSSRSKILHDDSRLHLLEPGHQDGAVGILSHSSRLGCVNEISDRISPCISASHRKCKRTSSNVRRRSQRPLNFSLESDMDTLVSVESNCLKGSRRDTLFKSGTVITGFAEVRQNEMMEGIECAAADFSLSSNSSLALPKFTPADPLGESTKFSNVDVSVKNRNTSLMKGSDEDSSRKHIFCLDHAVEVEKQLRPIGGVHMLLLCHPEYPKLEAEAKSLAAELGNNYHWKDIVFREATKEDQERIRSAVDDEEAIPGNGDWAVKLGINLYYSANLSRSPLYTKQIPYNSVIYKAFGLSSPTNSPTKPKVSGKGSSKQKKIVVAGKWCGKVWMSNQVHPYLAQRETQEEDSTRFLARATLNSKLNKKPETSLKIEEQLLPEKSSSPALATTIDRKQGRKRKEIFNEGATNISKCPLLHNSIEAAKDSSENNSPPCGRILRRGQTKHETPNLRSNRLKNIPQYDSNLKDELNHKDEFEGGPSTRLRRRPSKPAEEFKEKSVGKKQGRKKKAKKAPASSNDVKDEEAGYQCDMDGCTMSFSSKQELVLHKRNICPVKGCGKNFFSHKYLVQHRRVHMDDRPLKCPWKGCKMTFKWAWARTEHIRVHTGARPYVCGERGCGQTFRFVSDFSRHRRKTGHSVKGRR